MSKLERLAQILGVEIRFNGDNARPMFYVALKSLCDGNHETPDMTFDCIRKAVLLVEPVTYEDFPKLADKLEEVMEENDRE